MSKKNSEDDGDDRGLTYAQRILKQKMAESRRRSKYNNVRVRWKDRYFDSIYELDWAKKLDAMRRAKFAKDRVVLVEYQVPFEIVVNKTKVCKYIADFIVEYADGRVEVVDAKGVETDVYKLKKKLMRAVFGIEIVQV